MKRHDLYTRAARTAEVDGHVPGDLLGLHALTAASVVDHLLDEAGASRGHAPDPWKLRASARLAQSVLQTAKGDTELLAEPLEAAINCARALAKRLTSGDGHGPVYVRDGRGGLRKPEASDLDTTALRNALRAVLTVKVCATCERWDGGASMDGRCRRYAPRPNEPAHWPPTKREDWCGEHR